MNERIRELRKMLGLNQTDFGAKLDVSQRIVSLMETAGGTVTERNFNAICKTFNVNPDWLRNGVGEMFLETREALIQNIVEEYGLTANEAVLMRTFLELPEEQRAGVLKWAEKFATAMAAQMGVEFPQREEIPEHPTPAQKREIMEREIAAEEAAAKRGIATSSAFTGTSGFIKKFGNGA